MKKLLTAIALLTAVSTSAIAQDVEIKGIRIGDTQEKEYKNYKGETLAGFKVIDFHVMTESKDSNKIGYVQVVMDTDHYETVRDAFFTKYGKDNFTCKNGSVTNGFGAKLMNQKCYLGLTDKAFKSRIIISKYLDKISTMAVEMIEAPSEGYAEKENKKAAKDL